MSGDPTTRAAGAPERRKLMTRHAKSVLSGVALGLVPWLAADAEARAVDGDSRLEAAQRSAASDDCDGLPSAMPGWPYYPIWDYDAYAVPFALVGRWRRTTDRGRGLEREYRLGRSQVVIRVEESHRYDAQEVIRLVGKALARLPGGLTQRLPRTAVEIIGDRDTPFANYRIVYGPGGPGNRVAAFDPAFGVVFPTSYVNLDNAGRPVLGSSLSHRNFEELLIHELAHVLDYYAAHLAYHAGDLIFPTWSDSAQWRDAIAASPCAVSEYARSNAAEDFAESMLAWFAYYGGRTGALGFADRRRLKTRLGARFGVLNRLMHDRFPAAADGLDQIQ